MRIVSILIVLFLGFSSCKDVGKKEIEKKETPVVTAITSPVEKNSSLPFLFSDGKKILMSWVEKENDSLTQLRYSEFLEREWRPTQNILRGNDWFVNWADFPAIAENNGSLISHVLKKSSAGTYSYDIKLNLLPEGEKEWKTDLPLHTDGTPTEHGFVSALPYKEGFFITWLDGRNTEEDENGNRGAMTLRAAEVSVTGDVRNETELDARICDCCQTTAVITANGPVVMYRDRSEDEVRDMSIVRWDDGSWTAPQTVYSDNWQIKGCPVNGPKASNIGNALVMAWFTAADKPKVQIIFSSDGGLGFDSPIIVSEANPLGRVDVILLNEHEAIVSWVDHDEKAQLKAMKVNRDGSQGKQYVISDVITSRQSGFPQMERVGGELLFAWTYVSKEQSKVKTALVPLKNF
ncbi:hypothetical protein FEE95_12360 [Maribacter algarum]|uniref:Exo-alpha-sialidase n=1 Tax=Maribacter algarum (ex Zhang et al. 2020) TaxID=2578118 RepID=A0A5S3PTM7_9FLAO|nr:hypothetical protein [Maribacter algarum]TMM57273.1 hypothetical protein FEE95_12360 [Maribacter algarum]